MPPFCTSNLNSRKKSFILTLISEKNFNQQPLYSSSMEPYLSSLAPTDTIKDFTQDNAKLFKLKEFKNKI